MLPGVAKPLDGIMVHSFVYVNLATKHSEIRFVQYMEMKF